MRQAVQALGCAAALMAASPANVAQPASHYSGLEQRQIKSLSPEQIDELVNGRGMGLALAAELNGYPGPRHVLELADQLGLTPEQRHETERLFDEMRVGAMALGDRMIEREAALDRLFATGAANEAAVDEVAFELGRLQGELRAHHLHYHLAMRDLLTAGQVRDYQRLRGYTADGTKRRHGGHGPHG